MKAFFDHMRQWFDDPANQDALYVRFVRGHVQGALEKNFPHVRRAVGEDLWAELTRAYAATRPSTHFEVNQSAAAFPAFLADHAQALKLAAWLPALARFEWSDFEVYASPEDLPSTVQMLTPNPTLTVLQHSYQLVPWLRAGSARPSEPAPGDETVLMWRHPATHRTMYAAAEARALLVLKLAVEGLRAEAVSLPVQEVNALVQAWAKDGLVIAPRG